MSAAKKNFDMPNNELVYGFKKMDISSSPQSHPLEKILKNSNQSKEQLEMAMLRKSAGIHVPLRLLAEKRALSRVGHLSFLPRSNASLNSLTGHDELIGFEDYLGHREESEVMGQPHAMVEKSLGLL